MKEKYLKYKKDTRVSFHTSLISLILLIPSIIAYDLVFMTVFTISLLSSAIIYFSAKSKYKEILASFTKKCPLCEKEIVKKEIYNYYINGSLVDKIDFDTSIDDNSKRLIKVIKYKCENDVFDYSIIETYYYNKKNELKLLNRKENIII